MQSIKQRNTHVERSSLKPVLKKRKPKKGTNNKILQIRVGRNVKQSKCFFNQVENDNSLG